MGTCNNRWIDKWEQIVMVLLYVLMADCAIFGAGRAITFGPFGFRTVLAAVVMIAAVPVMLRDFKKLIRCRILWAFAALAVWLVFQTIRGLRNQNDLTVMATDLKGFWYFVVLIPAVCLLNSKKRIHTLMKVLLYSSAFLALVSLIATGLYKWNYELFMKLYSLDPYEFFLDLSVVIKRKVPRLFFKSSNYFLVGCAFSVYFYITEQQKCRWHYPVITGTCLFGVLMTYTRAVYLAAFVTAAMLALMVMCFGRREMRIKFWKHVVAAMLVFAMITVGLGALVGTNYMEYGITRVVTTFDTQKKTAAAPVKPEEKGPMVVKLSNTTASSAKPKSGKDTAAAMTKGSDRTRAKTLKEMYSYIQEAPLLGHGLGKAITCRHNGLTEYFYHDLLVKTGVIGLILYLLPVLWMLVGLVRKVLSKPDKLILGSWLAVLLGFMGFSYYNPYMNASLGILFYCCTVGLFVNLKHKRNLDRN